MKLFEWIAKAITGAFIALIALVMSVAISAVLAIPVMWMVNDLFTPHVLLSIFGVSHIGFTTAWGLSVLCSILFGSARSSSK